MKTQFEACDPEQLRLLAEDGLPIAELARLELHLEECPRCRESLDRLVNSDLWLDAVRRNLSDETGCWQDSHGEARDVLDFLAPTDWPDSLGRLATYEVRGVLGRGGMGVVLKAFDPALGRTVAIKVLSAALATNGAARRRFLREARSAAAVAHEHVVGVFAVVEISGLPFLVMEYVPGGSLQERLDKQGALSLAEILRIGMQTAAGLAAAHAQGLVHRDVKPANILLEGGVERVRLTDFGLARAVADAAMTHSGIVAGTPHYMAPEQAQGESVDHRADLFSLGSTMYAMCAGHPPFRAGSAVAVLRRVCDDPPRSLREVNAEIPQWLEAIIDRLMAKDPANRFQTANEVADLIARCLAHVQQPLTSPLPSELVKKAAPQSSETRNPPRRLKIISLAATLAIAATLFVVAWISKPIGQSLDEPHANAIGPRQIQPPTDSHGGTEELERLLGAARKEALDLEADVRRFGSNASQDSLTAMSRALYQNLEALERDVLSVRTSPADSALPNRHANPTERR